MTRTPSRSGYVYSLTTTTGQGHGTAAGPPPQALTLPYHNDLSAGADGEPALLDPQDGAFELAPCTAPNGSTTCTEQTAAGQPVLWPATTGRHPFAIIGSDWKKLRHQRRRHAPPTRLGRAHRPLPRGR